MAAEGIIQESADGAAPPEATQVYRSSAKQGKARAVELDVLRGIAILLVLGRHRFVPGERAGLLRPLADAWYHIGWTGVDLFFVLSGFLVGGLLFKEIRAHQRLDVGRFLLRRALRIWPLYFTYLAWFVVWATWLAAVRPVAGGVGDVIRSLIPNFVHLQNYLGTPARHTWSLAVEEHFYLVLPLVLWWLLARPRPGGALLAHMPFLAAALMAVCTGLRLYTTATRPYDNWTHLFPTHLRLDALFWGVLLAYFHHLRPTSLAFASGKTSWLFVGGAVLIAPMCVLAYDHPFVTTIGSVCLYTGYGCFLLALVYCPPGSWLRRVLNSRAAQVVATVGFFSYPIYLWHQDVTNLRATEKLLFLLNRPGVPDELQWLYGMAAWTVLCVALGVLLQHTVERPVMRLRERCFPSRENG